MHSHRALALVAADVEEALSGESQGIRFRLARWPELAERIERQYGVDDSASSPEAELIRRFESALSYLAEQVGSRSPTYSNRAHENLITALTIDPSVIKLSLLNETGASAGDRPHQPDQQAAHHPERPWCQGRRRMRM